MNKFGFAAVVASASGLTAAILGLAAPAQAATAVNTPISVASAIKCLHRFAYTAIAVSRFIGYQLPLRTRPRAERW